MVGTIEKINKNDNMPKYMFDKFLVRYDMGCFGWKNMKLFPTEEQAIMFCRENGIKLI